VKAKSGTIKAKAVLKKPAAAPSQSSSFKLKAPSRADSPVYHKDGRVLIYDECYRVFKLNSYRVDVAVQHKKFSSKLRVFKFALSLIDKHKP
jgi:hypothetical protein